MKKYIIIIFAIFLFGVIGGGYFYLSRPKAPDYEFAIARRGNLSQEVNVTGRVKSAENVELAFEKGGKIAAVNVKIGDNILAGKILARLENDDVTAQLVQAEAGVASAKAQLAQYQAALETQDVKLAELKRGSRLEEIQISETKLSNAQKTLNDVEINLTNVKNKADNDLASLYNDIKNILNDAYTKADDAINKQTDDMFTNDQSTNPQLTFLVTDNQAETDSEWRRYSIGIDLKNFKSEIDGLPTDQSGLDQPLVMAGAHLASVRTFLIRLNDAVNTAVNLSSVSSASYKSSLNTARVNIDTASSNISSQQQIISAQKVTNQNNISTAESKVTEAKNSEENAKNELTLKKAGSTAEQISAQEAQVRQAEANIVLQDAQIKQAKANVQNYQAQLDKTILRAPINGVVTKQDAKIGEISSVNTSLISIIAAEFSASGNPIFGLETEANVPEADVAKIKIGDPAKITLDAYGSGVVFEAKVIKIDPAETMIDGVATYKTTFFFSEEDERVKPGMTANIDILTASKENIIFVPQRALIINGGNQFVKMLEGETVKEIKVISGLRASDGNIEIVEGVKEGDKIIIYAK